MLCPFRNYHGGFHYSPVTAREFLDRTGTSICLDSTEFGYSQPSDLNKPRSKFAWVILFELVRRHHTTKESATLFGSNKQRTTFVM